MKFIVATLWLASAALLGNGLAFAGPGSSAGGDVRAIQFKNLGGVLVDFLRVQPNLPRELREIPLKKLKKAVKKTKVESTSDELTLTSEDGTRMVVKDAINNRKHHSIIFSRDFWDDVEDGSHRAALVLHEYLLLMGVADKDFERSHFLYDLPFLKDYLNALPEAHAVDGGVDLDFMVKCIVDYKGQHIDRIEPIGASDTGMTSFIAHDLDRGPNGESLKFMLYNPNDPTFRVFTYDRPRTAMMGNSVCITLGWARPFEMPSPDKVIFDQEIKLVPGFRAEFSLPEHDLKVSCRQISMQEFLRNDPLFQPPKP